MNECIEEKSLRIKYALLLLTHFSQTVIMDSFYFILQFNGLISQVMQPTITSQF